jgi:hypothetical protein
MPFDDPHQFSGCVENAQAVCKPGVSRAWIYEFGETQLLNATQSLEMARLDHAPHRIMELVGGKLYEIVQGIADSLGFVVHDSGRILPA